MPEPTMNIKEFYAANGFLIMAGSVLIWILALIACPIKSDLVIDRSGFPISSFRRILPDESKNVNVLLSSELIGGCEESDEISDSACNKNGINILDRPQ